MCAYVESMEDSLMLGFVHACMSALVCAHVYNT